jgi:hypothetical protein
MRGQHPRRPLGSDHRAIADFTIDAEVSTTRGDIGSAWAIAFVAVGLLGLLSAFA